MISLLHVHIWLGGEAILDRVSYTRKNNLPIIWKVFRLKFIRKFILHHIKCVIFDTLYQTEAACC
jgi:hypothetical protein